VIRFKKTTRNSTTKIFNQMCWEHWNAYVLLYILVLHSSEFERYWRMLNSCLTLQNVTTYMYLQFRYYKRSTIIITITLSNARESLAQREIVYKEVWVVTLAWINFQKVIWKKYVQTCENLGSMAFPLPNIIP